MLSMYDDEFEDGTEALKEQAKQVRTFTPLLFRDWLLCGLGQSLSIHTSTLV